MKNSGILWKLCMLLMAGIFLFSVWKLYGIFSEYKKGENEYASLAEAVVLTAGESQERGEIPEPAEYPEAVSIDFQRLEEINPDVIGWLRLDEELKIDYPVVLGDDNAKYLATTFDGTKNPAGCLFADFQNSPEFDDRNTYIYGHNMKNGSMFGRLRKYKDEKFCREHPYFMISTKDGRCLTYEIFSVVIVEDVAENYVKSYENDREFLNYIERMKNQAIYFNEETISEESKIVTLSTCTNVTEEERLLVQGVLKNAEMIYDSN